MRKALHTLILIFLLNPVYQAMAGPNFSRLIGLTTTQYIAPSYITQDSTHFYYTATASSDMKKGIILYDSAVKYNYSASKFNIYSKDQQIINFTTDSLQLSRSYLWVDSTKSWSLQTMNMFFRDANNLDTVVLKNSNPFGVYWHTQYKYYSIYDGSKNLLKQITLIYDSTLANFDTLRMSTYTYDASNNLLTANYYNYSYAKASFDPAEAYIYSYTSGKLSMYQHMHWDVSMLSYVVDQIASIAYDGSGRQHTVTYFEQDPSTHIMGPSREDSNAYDASGNLIALTNLVYNSSTMGYDYSLLYQWTFNTYNQPLIYTTLTWDGTGFSPQSGQDVKNYYYYEITNDVKTIGNTISDLQIYPMPAQSFLHINLQLNEPKPFTISLFDLSGKLVLQNSFGATKNYNNNLLIPQLTSGNYTLVITAGDEKIARQVVIQK